MRDTEDAVRDAMLNGTPGQRKALLKELVVELIVCVACGIGTANGRGSTRQGIGDPASRGVVSIWPPVSPTETMLAQSEVFGNASKWKAPWFKGRVVAAFACAGSYFARTGEALEVQVLAHDLGVEDAQVP